jgi:hypothetical protein
VSRARLERQFVLLLTPTRASTPAKAKIRVKAKADARLATMAAKARTLARARVDAPLTNRPKNSQNSIFLSSGVLK